MATLYDILVGMRDALITIATAITGIWTDGVNAQPHAVSHTANGSDPVILTAAQVSDLDTLYPRLNTINQFSLRQDIRGNGSNKAAGLFIPGLSDDTLPALHAGSLDSAQVGGVFHSNTNIALNAFSNSGFGAKVGSNSNVALILESLNNVPLDASVIASSNTLQQVMFLRGRRENNAGSASGFGLRTTHMLATSTGTDQFGSHKDIRWTDATDATRSSEERTSLSKNGVMVETMRLDTADNANQTGLLLLHNGVFKRVRVGATDSGGVGFRSLIVAN